MPAILPTVFAFVTGCLVSLAFLRRRGRAPLAGQAPPASQWWPVFGNAETVSAFVEDALSKLTQDYPWLTSTLHPADSTVSGRLTWLLQAAQDSEVSAYYRLDADLARQEFVVWFGSQSGFFAIPCLEQWARPAVHYDFRLYDQHLDPISQEPMSVSGKPVPREAPSPSRLTALIREMLHRQDAPPSLALECHYPMNMIHW